MAAVDWFAHAEVAEPAAVPRRRRATAAARPKAPVRSRARQTNRRVRLPIVWMTVFALLLAGVVAVNVAVLRAHVAVSNLDQQRAKLEAQNQALASRLSAASSAPRIEAAARRLGLVQAPATGVTYLDLMPRSR
jgi:cell division protein FtsL